MPLVAAAAIGVGGSLLANRSANKAQDKAIAASQQATDQATAEQRRQYDLSRADMQPWLTTGGNALSQLSALYGLEGSSAQPAATAPQAQGSAVVANQGFGGGGWGDRLSPITMGTGASPPAWKLGSDGASSPMGPPSEDWRGAQLAVGPAAQAGIGNGMAPPAQQVSSGAQPAQSGGQFASFFQSPDYQFRLNESMRGLTARNAALGIQDSGAAQRSALGLAGNLASGEFNNYANRLSALAGVGQTAASQNASLGANFAGNYGNALMNNAQNLGSSYQQQGQNNASMFGGLAGIGTGLIGQMWR